MPSLESPSMPCRRGDDQLQCLDRPALFFSRPASATAIAVIVSVSRAVVGDDDHDDHDDDPAGEDDDRRDHDAPRPRRRDGDDHDHDAPSAPTAPGAWPADASGYTVVLESIPLSAGRAFAVSRAGRRPGRLPGSACSLLGLSEPPSRLLRRLLRGLPDELTGRRRRLHGPFARLSGRLSGPRLALRSVLSPGNAGPGLCNMAGNRVASTVSQRESGP